MELKHIKCPCTNCKERHEKCHSICQKYKRYNFLCNIERTRNKEKKDVDNAVREITYKGYNSRNSNPEALKHGRKNNGHQ